jgi:hypothetical protein
MVTISRRNRMLKPVVLIALAEFALMHVPEQG